MLLRAGARVAGLALWGALLYAAAVAHFFFGVWRPVVVVLAAVVGAVLIAFDRQFQKRGRPPGFVVFVFLVVVPWYLWRWARTGRRPQPRP